MKDIKVSVLIYVLNDVSHIEKCIESVICQSLQDIEILLIDGGSTDGTVEILNRFSAQDERIKLVGCSSGVGLQFNTGLRTAQGKYIGICESDDYLQPDMYEKQYAIAEKNQLDVLKANVNRFCQLGDHQTFFPFQFSGDRSIYDKVLYSQNDMTFLKLGVNGFWSGLYRRDFLLKNSIYMNETKGASYQDISISFLAAAKAERTMVMEKAFYNYRMDNPNSSINNPNKISILIDEYMLLKKRLCQEKLFERFQEVYLSWKISGHLWFYDNLSAEMKEKYVSLMYRDLLEELTQIQYTETELSTEEKNIVEKVRQSEQMLCTLLKQSDDAKNMMSERISSIPADRDIVIFGIGNMGEIVQQYLSYLNKKIVAFTDNNSSAWGCKKNQVDVMPPSEVCLQYPNAIYIVANASYYQDIVEQLVRKQISRDNLIICNSYDFFLKKILMMAIKEEN